MRTTGYVHVNSHQDVSMNASQMTTGAITLTISGGGSDLCLFLSPDQLLQMHATLGAYIAEHHDKFVKHEITKVEEVK